MRRRENTAGAACKLVEEEKFAIGSRYGAIGGICMDNSLTRYYYYAVNYKNIPECKERLIDKWKKSGQRKIWIYGILYRWRKHITAIITGRFS